MTIDLCPDCDGSGEDDDGWRCPRCKGVGMVYDREGNEGEDDDGEQDADDR